jgi:hypothetical protein
MPNPGMSLGNAELTMTDCWVRTADPRSSRHFTDVRLIVLETGGLIVQSKPPESFLGKTVSVYSASSQWIVQDGPLP